MPCSCSNAALPIPDNCRSCGEAWRRRQRNDLPAAQERAVHCLLPDLDADGATPLEKDARGVGLGLDLQIGAPREPA